MVALATADRIVPRCQVTEAAPMRRSRLILCLGALACLVSQGLFYFAVLKLYLFLRDGIRPGPGYSGVVLDTILALQFAILHSLLLWPPVRKRLNRWAPNSFYGLAFTTVSSLSLLLLFANWRSFGPVIWQVDGVLATIISVAYHVSFLALGYSMWITGLGHQTGTTAWLAWWRGTKPTPRAFAPQGAYRFLRHPIYFSMGGLIWFTPTMTLDHALLTGLWTAYLLIGSWIKDERLAFFIGGPYREYQQRVPGFPGMPRGVLGRRTP